MAATPLDQSVFGASLSFTQPNGNTLFPNKPTKTLDQSVTYKTGVGAGQQDTMAVGQFTIPASATLTIDLFAGTWANSTGGLSGNLLNYNNEQVTFARIKSFLLELIDKASGSTGVHINAAVTHACTTLAGKAKSKGTGVDAQNGSIAWNDATATGEAVVNTSTNVLAIVNDDSSHVATINLAIGGGAS